MMVNPCYATIHLLDVKSSLPTLQNQKYDKVRVRMFFSANFIIDLCIEFKNLKFGCLSNLRTASFCLIPHSRIRS